MQRKALTIRLKSKSDQKYPKKLPTKLFTKFDASLTASEQNNHTTGSHTTATEVTDNDTSPKSTNEQTPSVSYDYKNSGQRITDQHIERKQSAPLVHEPSRTRTRTEQQVLLQYMASQNSRGAGEFYNKEKATKPRRGIPRCTKQKRNESKRGRIIYKFTKPKQQRNNRTKKAQHNQ